MRRGNILLHALYRRFKADATVWRATDPYLAELKKIFISPFISKQQLVARLSGPR
jgi:hypothetical protein